MTFRRTGYSEDGVWFSDMLLGQADAGFVPAPFGVSPTYFGSVRWTDEYYSFIVPRSWVPGSNSWSVRDTNGELVEFQACATNPDGGLGSGVPQSCFASPAESSLGGQQKLYYSNQDGGAGTFVLYGSDGTRYTYGTNGTASTTWSSADGGIPPHYFLGKIDAPQYPGSDHTRTVATLTYSTPTGASWSDANGSGTPYLSTVTNEDGQVLSFTYDAVASPWLAGTSEYVIWTMSLSGTLVAQYSYASDTDGGATYVAGLLNSVHYSEATNHTIYYDYFDGGAVLQSLVEGVPVSTHVLAADSLTDAVIGFGEGFSIWDGGVIYPDSGSCSSNSAFCTAQFTSEIASSVAQVGDGNQINSAVNLLSSYVAQRAVFSLPALVASHTDSCSSGGTCTGASAGTENWAFAPFALDGGDYGVGETTAYTDKNGNTTNYAYTPDTAATAVGFAPVVPSSSSTPLATTKYTFERGGQTQNPVSYQELETAQYRGSVIQSGADAGTSYVYDTATNRLKASFQFGYTETHNDSTNAWSVTPQVVGTFYFTTGVCTTATSDGMDRVVEVHGPCFVSSVSAVDCPSGGGATPDVPVTHYTYYPSTGYGNSNNRLAYVDRYVNVTAAPTSTGACSGATYLRTTYANYTARGQPTSVSDANSQTTTYQYKEDQVVSATDPLGNQTQYLFENNKLTLIGHPGLGSGGGYEVFCYHTGSTSSCNTSNPWSEQLQWKAKSPNSNGSSWTEQVTYSYFPDGTPETETYLTSAAGLATRKVVNHGADPQRRPTMEKVGTYSNPHGYTSVRLFDGADNLIGVSLPFDSAPALCNGIAANHLPSSPLCQAFEYDTANRLIGVDQNTGAATIHSAFTRDAQDNIAAVLIGADGGGELDSVGSYQYDDFGHVVAATLSWQATDGGADPGITYFEHDAFGNTVKKQEPGMYDTGTGTPEWVQYTFDGVNRQTDELRTYNSGSSTESVIHLNYDSQLTVTGCPSGSGPFYTAGRVQVISDSFGQTWMEYDKDGRVVQAQGRRSVGGILRMCGTDPYNNPATSYSYDVRSNITSVTSPYGRVATYHYGTGGTDNRVQSIDVCGFGGTTCSVAHTSLINNIAWEPYGGLRAYEVDHFSSGSPKMTVYYFREGQGDQAPSGGCPESVPSGASSDGASRVTGVWVMDGGVNLDNTQLSTGSRLFQTAYTYQADQISRTDTCLLTDATDRAAYYYYDQMLRLSGADGGNVDPGPFTHRAYSYDLRGNRTQMIGDVGDCTYSDTYATLPHLDWLTKQATSCSGAILGQNYSYGLNGDVSQIAYENNSTGPSATYAFTNGPGGNGSGASDSVFRALTIGGVTYNYFYDSKHRRRLKSYPTSGVYDEYLYDAADEMLVDQGNDSSTSPTELIVDDYVYLDGRPVVTVRGTVNNSTFARNADSTGLCSRYGDGANCGFYYPITDPIGKPIATFDDKQMLAGVGEYDPFGRANRVLRDSETPSDVAGHIYNQAHANWASFGEPAVSGITTALRVHYNMIDGRRNQAPCIYHGTDQVVTTSGTTVVDTLLNQSTSPQWGNWIVSDGGGNQVQVSLTLGTPRYTSSCVSVPFTTFGAVIDGYEYRRYQNGGNPFWVPVRFPGQYADQESDLYQNWNRFYDPSIGRYLEPEPLLDQPEYVAGRARQGHSVPVYGYAGNNPICDVDTAGDVDWNPNGGISCHKRKVWYFGTPTPGPIVCDCFVSDDVNGCMTDHIVMDRIDAANSGNEDGLHCGVTCSEAATKAPLKLTGANSPWKSSDKCPGDAPPTFWDKCRKALGMKNKSGLDAADPVDACTPGRG